MKIKNLILRAGTGILFILLILLGILGGKYLFLLIFGAILGVSLFEFYRMVEEESSHDISKIFNIITGVLIFMSLHLFLEDISRILLPLFSLLYLLILFSSSSFIKRDDILFGIIYSVFGQLYITIPLCMLMIMSNSKGNPFGERYDSLPLLALFVFIWINDTAAYFIGSLIGKHKLVKHISPKKTTEGFVAGAVFTILASTIFAYHYNEFSILFWIGFAVIVSLFGSLGDLFESLIKRTCSVKDTGKLIPGHGGILDRMDSLLIAIPALYLYLIIAVGL